MVSWVKWISPLRGWLVGSVKCTVAPRLGLFLCGKPPAMRFDDHPTDTQPDPHALLFGREERFEHPRQTSFSLQKPEP